MTQNERTGIWSDVDTPTRAHESAVRGNVIRLISDYLRSAPRSVNVGKYLNEIDWRATASDYRNSLAGREDSIQRVVGLIWEAIEAGSKISTPRIDPDLIEKLDEILFSADPGFGMVRTVIPEIIDAIQDGRDPYQFLRLAIARDCSPSVVAAARLVRSMLKEAGL